MSPGFIQEEQPRAVYQSYSTVKESVDCGNQCGKSNERVKRTSTHSDRALAGAGGGVHVKRHPGTGCQNPGRARKVTVQKV